MYRIVKISFLLLLIISVQELFGQTSPDKIPNGIAIQSVARDASGNAASNRNIFLKVDLRQGTATGESVLIETHTVTSNDEGIFNFYIGQGVRVSGTNSLIFLDWKGKIFFLNIKMAIEPSLPTPGWSLEREYVDLGTSQIWSVPYAFTSYRSVVADSAMNIAGIVSGANGGTGISNAGRKIILGGDLEIKGTGNLIFKTTGASIIELPTSGKMVSNNSTDTLFNKSIMSPLLIGEPKSVTPTVSSNDNSIATTNFVNVLLSSDSNSVNQRLSQLANSSKDSIDKKLNIKDTTLMLLPYLKYTKTSDSTYADLNLKTNIIIDSNLTVKGDLLLSKGLKFNDSLLVSSGARIDSSLLLKGRLVLEDSLLAKANVIIDSTLIIKGKLYLGDSLVASGNGLIKGKVQLDSTLFVNRATTLNDSLNVNGRVQLDSTLFVNRVATLNDSLNVKGNSLFDNNLTVGSDLEVKGNLILNTGLKFNDSLIVSKGARIDSSLILKGKLLLGDSLVASGNGLIKGKVQLDSTLFVNRVTTLNDSLNVNGRVQLDSTLVVKNNVSFRDSLFVKGNVFLDSNLEIKGNLILNTGLKFNDSLIVSKGARIDSSLILKGKLLLGDSLVAGGNGLIKGRVQLDSTLFVNRVTTLNDSLFVKGNSLFDNNLTVGSDLEVQGNLILNTGLKFNDSLIVTKGARIDSSLILKGKLLLGDSLVAGGNGIIKGVAQLDSTLTVNKNVNFRDSLFVKGQVKLDSNVYIRGNFRLGGDLILDSGLFRENFIVNLGEGIKFGRYNYKDTIYAKGKSIDKVFYDILTDITHPVYVAPTLKILNLPGIDASTTNKILRYEIGSNLGSLNFSSSFSQNNAGPRETTTYKKNASNFIRTDSTDIVSNLTDTLYYTSTIAYDSGAILTNRIGDLDTLGRINRGTILSDTISIFPVSKNYWGYFQSADSLNITDSLLLGKDTSINNKGFSDFASSPYKSSFSIPIAGGEKYIYYAYPATYPDLTSVMVGPFESVDAFTKIVRNVINEQGHSQAYKIYVSINNFSDKVEKIIVN